MVFASPKKIIAIEIKWSEKFNTKWKESLEFFSEQQLKKPVELVMLYRGQRKLKDGLVDIIPFDQFLNELE